MYQMNCGKQDSAGQSCTRSQEMDRTVGLGVKCDKAVGEKLLG